MAEAEPGDGDLSREGGVYWGLGFLGICIIGKD